MKTISTQARIVAAFFAVVMSTVVLGGTVTGMQSASRSAEMPTIAMERVVITAPAELSSCAGAQRPVLLRRQARWHKAKPGFGRVLRLGLLICRSKWLCSGSRCDRLAHSVVAICGA